MVAAAAVVLLWNAVEYCGMLWNTVECCGILWNVVEYCAVLLWNRLSWHQENRMLLLF